MRRCAAAGVYTCARDDVRERYVSEAGASSYVPMAMRGMSRGAQELSMYGATMRAGLCSGCLVRCMIDVWWLDPEPDSL